jgi:hypothetical protein
MMKRLYTGNRRSRMDTDAERPGTAGELVEPAPQIILTASSKIRTIAK